MTSLVETKRKSPRNVECLVSAYRIRFEQAKEHSGLTDKEEDDEEEEDEDREIRHYRVDYVLHLDEKYTS